MSPLPRISASDWSAEIADAAREFMNGSIEVIDPSDIITTPYDPATDTGGNDAPAVVMAARPARIQHINAPNTLAGSAEWSTKRRFRFQVDLLEGDVALRKGQLVRVLDGGKDATLTGFTYPILSAVNSSHAALRTIETVGEAS